MSQFFDISSIVSELLADALARRRVLVRGRPSFTWPSRSMRALVDLSDKDAVYAALDDELPFARLT